MKLKVCGITLEKQLEALANLDIDMVGFNFYASSKRYVDHNSDLVANLNHDIKKVGVFVNHSIDDILDRQIEYKLDYAQLHGDEDFDFCKALSSHISIIKVWRIKDSFDLEQVKQVDKIVALHLFDTYTKDYGGSGETFDWQILNQLAIKKPIMLSGGISIDHVKQLGEQKLKNLWGVDINSKFEITPGIKDINLVERFQDKIKSL